MTNDNPEFEDENGNLRLLTAAASAPEEACEENEAVREAFDAELRKLAEEIVEFHPSLTQLLLSMSEPVTNPVHGQN